MAIEDYIHFGIRVVTDIPTKRNSVVISSIVQKLRNVETALENIAEI